MKRYLITATVAIASMAYSEESNPFANDMHRVYVQPDVLFGFSHSKSSDGEKIDSSARLVGLNGGYEFCLPNRFYVGVRGLFAVGENSYVVTTPDSKEKIKDENTKIRGEAHFGLTRQYQNFSFISYLGFGEYHNEVNPDVYVADWLYAPVGVKLQYNFSKVSGVGLDLRYLRYFYLDETRYGEEYHGFQKNTWGYEIAASGIWHLSTKLEGRVEPYFSKYPCLDDLCNVYYVGGRLSMAYSF